MLLSSCNILLTIDLQKKRPKNGQFEKLSFVQQTLIMGSTVYPTGTNSAGTFSWTKETGPGTVTFSNDSSSSEDPNFSANQAGTYTAKVEFTIDNSPGDCTESPITVSDTSGDIGVVEVDLDIWNGGNGGNNGTAGAAVSEDNEESVGAYLLVNWDDDNDDEDPDVDDTSVTDEDDLAKITLDWGVADRGTLQLIKTGDHIKIWQNNTKGTQQTMLTWNLATTTPPSTLWLEADEYSLSERDVELELKYTDVGSCTTSDYVNATAVMINLGNAVYRENGFWAEPDRGHSALVTEYIGACTKSDLDDDTKFLITEMDGPTDYRTLATMTDEDDTGLEVYGCYTEFFGLTYAQRYAILQIASALVDDAANIGYTALEALKYEDWDGTLNDIFELRCDGLVEVCYEYNGINVWAMKRVYGGSTTYNYDICSQNDVLTYSALTRTWWSGSNTAKDNLEEHNDFDSIFWEYTLMPATQCGYTTPQNSHTKFSAEDLCKPIGHKGGN